MTVPDLPGLANLFRAKIAARDEMPAMRGSVAATRSPRVDLVLAELFETAEAERMLRLPLTNTDMVDFEFEVTTSDGTTDRTMGGR
ncbi:hypothetical protein ABIC65_002555 [Sphingomonas trueperi]|uniref:hypothetical protein n=1 Tax=Sphingomonas trueperi TaxID=53317 RepID=UPI0033970747